jgi:hypothetical protein
MAPATQPLDLALALYDARRSTDIAAPAVPLTVMLVWTAFRLVSGVLSARESVPVEFRLPAAITVCAMLTDNANVKLAGPAVLLSKLARPMSLPIRTIVAAAAKYYFCILAVDSCGCHIRVLNVLLVARSAPLALVSNQPYAPMLNATLYVIQASLCALMAPVSPAIRAHSLGM